MSDLRVALVAEGPTDAIVIEAAIVMLRPSSRGCLRNSESGSAYRTIVRGQSQLPSDGISCVSDAHRPSASRSM